MKKLLSLLAVSTLVGTSTSSLKPVFTNSVVSHGFKSNQVNNKDISIRGDNDNPFINQVNSLAGPNIFASNGTLWVVRKLGTETGLYKSIDNGLNFEQITKFDKLIYSFTFSQNGDIYIGTETGLYKFDLLDNLLKIEKPDYIGSKYNGFVYKNEQKLDFKQEYLKTATLDGNSITVPSTDVDILSGEHTLVLTLKDQYKKYLDLFSGDVTTGQVTYKLWVKTSVDKSKISYETNQDTDLLSGLVSDLGNTNGSDIIQTKAKTGTHNATLKIMVLIKELKLWNK